MWVTESMMRTLRQSQRVHSMETCRCGHRLTAHSTDGDRPCRHRHKCNCEKWDVDPEFQMLVRWGFVPLLIDTPAQHKVAAVMQHVLMISEGWEPEIVTAEVRREAFESDGDQCRACGATDQLTVDHIWPQEWWGTNNRINLQTLCRPCNSRKGARFHQYPRCSANKLSR
jgi:hypothetical protein